jgi:hypothetical protein
MFGIGVYTFYNYVFSEPTKVINIASEFIGQSDEFKYLFTEDLEGWSNKVIEIKGTITGINDNGVLLDENIYCQFDQNTDLPSIAVNKEVVIKGKVVGFDELLMEIKLNQCTIIQN